MTRISCCARGRFATQRKFVSVAESKGWQWHSRGSVDIFVVKGASQIHKQSCESGNLGLWDRGDLGTCTGSGTWYDVAGKSVSLLLSTALSFSVQYLCYFSVPGVLPTSQRSTFCSGIPFPSCGNSSTPYTPERNRSIRAIGEFPYRTRPLPWHCPCCLYPYPRALHPPFHKLKQKRSSICRNGVNCG